jgi:hypothetical protein
VAKHFYSEFVPGLEELAAKHEKDADPAKAAAAKALAAKLHEVLASEDHAWYTGKMDPAEAERRKKAAAEFKARYEGPK